MSIANPRMIPFGFHNMISNQEILFPNSASPARLQNICTLASWIPVVNLVAAYYLHKNKSTLIEFSQNCVTYQGDKVAYHFESENINEKDKSKITCSLNVRIALIIMQLFLLVVIIDVVVTAWRGISGGFSKDFSASSDQTNTPENPNTSIVDEEDALLNSLKNST